MDRLRDVVAAILPLALLLGAACECTRPVPPSSDPTGTASYSKPTSSPPAQPIANAPAPSPRSDTAPRVFPDADSHPTLPDRGIFSDLDPGVRLRLPAWLQQGPSWVLQVASPSSRLVFLAGECVGFAPSDWQPDIQVADVRDLDRDNDGIPNQLDILMGAKKAVLNGAAYKDGYRVLSYPGGDMPRTEGVCTDVVVRSLRNAGFDLQQLVHEDAQARPAAYPGIRKHDTNIDHRRVRNLLPYFKAHWRQLPADPREPSVPWLPGDVILLDTMHDAQPEHIGIVSDRLGRSGLPLIVNNWTDGYKTSEMDLLAFVPVTHRFRAPAGVLPVPQQERGASGWLGRLGLRVGEAHRQLLIVTAPWWGASGGVLHRFEREGQGEWQELLPRFEVRLGAGGLGRGRGLHDEASGALAMLQAKREGDRRSPAGVFALGTAFGTSPTKPYRSGMWPWRAVGDADVWVDDPASPSYNTWQRADDASAGWASAERLSSYEMGLVVEHNTGTPQSGAGSAIFLHAWSGTEPTLGCTGMSREALLTVLGWLAPQANPLLAQGAGPVL